MTDPRSLGATLMSAASTLAIFSAANWDTSHLNGFWRRILDHTLAIFAFPLKALSNSLVKALAVRKMEKSLDRLRNGAQEGDYPSHGSVAIVTGCPIFIRTPVVEYPSRIDGCSLISDWEIAEMQELCPLELGPRADGQPEAAHGRSHALPSPSSDFMYFRLGFMYDDMANNLCNDLFNNSAHRNVPDVDFWYPYRSSEMRARLALLGLRLVPDDKKLSFLRSRTGFQSTISALQASGYVLGVVERMWQHLAISPTEAIVCFFSFLVALQLLVELYASGNFQRPLLLHLTSQQFASFRHVLSTSSPSSPPHDVVAVKRVIAATDFDSIEWEIRFFSLVSFLFLIPSMYYYFHFRHASLLSSLALLLFSLAPSLVAIVGLIYDCGIDSHILQRLGALSIIIQYFMYVGSIILGVVSTIIAWPLFNKPTHNWYAWLLPHVSG